MVGAIPSAVMLPGQPVGGSADRSTEGTNMTPRIVTCAFAAAALFGVTACSETPSDPAATTTTDSATAEPTTASEEPSATDTETSADEEQSVEEVCASFTEPIARASEELPNIATDATADPQAAVDAWSEVVDAYESAVGDITNEEVQTVATAAYEDLKDLRDQMQKAFVEKDASAMGDYTDAASAFQESQTELMALCAG